MCCHGELKNLPNSMQATWAVLVVHFMVETKCIWFYLTKRNRLNKFMEIKL